MPTSFRFRLAALLIPLVAALGLAACGGGAAPTAAPVEPFDPSVTPLTEEEAAIYEEIANPVNVTPCGVFNVNGHGDKIVTMAQYPACRAAAYEVYCLDANAQWINDAVTNVSTAVDGESVTFTSAQDGLCAVFPASE